ncbi:hypothetical protein MRB53_023599 [Persea americana]|uniref:Uncharacterized protein n=1 Tax=Persea americana TaxID=3435 RepID=A0ACC2LAN9_PERAE|nr:hypothetical protein MRB53_023599 [Persea americana]
MIGECLHVAHTNGRRRKGSCPVARCQIGVTDEKIIPAGRSFCKEKQRISNDVNTSLPSFSYSQVFLHPQQEPEPIFFISSPSLLYPPKPTNSSLTPPEKLPPFSSSPSLYLCSITKQEPQKPRKI